MTALTSRLRSTFKQLWSVKGLLLVLLVAAGWVLVARFAAESLIVRVPLEQADVIVVLSGSAAYKERASKAAELYRAGLGRRIILTNDDRQGGWSNVEERNPYFYERTRQELLAAGVSAADVVVLADPVYSTHDEAVLLRKRRDEVPFASMIVVTSAYHSRRALWTLNRAFAGSQTSIGIEPVPPGYQTPKPATWWLHLQGWEDVPFEYVKIGYYWCRY